MQLIVQLIFIKNPGKHIKEAAGNIWDGVKIYQVKH
ncbi:putative structural injection transglycosylase [Escherichia coli]|nr:putative structural injection transglycosylase [Escherichia coli]